MNTISLGKWLLCLFLVVNLAACQSMAKPRMLPAEVHIYNTVSGTSIFNVRVNVYSKTLDRGSSGGEGCCIGLPEQWQPDMVATVEWVKDPNPDANPGGVKEPKRNPNGSITPEWEKWMAIHKANYTRHQVRVSVPKYQESASMNLVFLPCDEVYPLIDAVQRSYVLGNLRGVKDVEKEVIRRLGKERVCRQK
ncbi:DUF3304 domain-containing protein [Pseudogulbenkiania sp. MAI-1]|uniref:DUF3304 domain-containing protein n=1 Tax=Pseudogulbenkiania sp. MAI-1 TaxID=990370 RepID=UPI000A001CE4|nr:DUF3304 domain-containing protein [Pseudogulbenkiania sp. MAI-1]